MLLSSLMFYRLQKAAFLVDRFLMLKYTHMEDVQAIWQSACDELAFYFVVVG